MTLINNISIKSALSIKPSKNISLLLNQCNSFFLSQKMTLKIFSTPIAIRLPIAIITTYPNQNKINQLETTFFKLIISRKCNIIVGCFYKHPNMDVADFNKNILTFFLINY